MIMNATSMKPNFESIPFVHAITNESEIIVHPGHYLSHYLQINGLTNPGIPITLKKVLNFLARVVAEKRLYDTKNDNIVVCDHEFKQIFNMDYVHVKQVRTIVILKSFILPSLFNLTFYPPMSPTPMTFSIPINTPPDEYTRRGKTLVTYELTPRLKEILSISDTYLPLSTLMHTLISYVIQSPTIIIDERNPYIANIKDDPLSSFLNVDFISSNQMFDILRGKKLIIRKRKRQTRT